MENISYPKKDVKTARLEQLFGSKTRAQLVRLFLEQPEKAYFIREMTRILSTQIHSVRRELYNLLDLGLIKVVTIAEVEGEELYLKGLRAKKYFQANTEFLLYFELKNLIEKSGLLVERDMIEDIKKAGDISLLLLTGKFVGNEQLPTDMLIVGDVARERVSAIVGEYEKNTENVIRYTIMAENEFQYRKEITDKFLYDILVHRYITLLDRLTKLV